MKYVNHNQENEEKEVVGYETPSVRIFIIHFWNPKDFIFLCATLSINYIDEVGLGYF